MVSCYQLLASLPWCHVFHNPWGSQWGRRHTHRPTPAGQLLPMLVLWRLCRFPFARRLQAKGPDSHNPGGAADQFRSCAPKLWCDPVWVKREETGLQQENVLQF